MDTLDASLSRCRLGWADLPLLQSLPAKCKMNKAAYYIEQQGGCDYYMTPVSFIYKIYPQVGILYSPYIA